MIVIVSPIAGFWPTAMGILPYAGLNFYAYGGLKNLYRNRVASAENRKKDPPLHIKLAIGAISGSFAQTVCYPLVRGRGGGLDR